MSGIRSGVVENQAGSAFKEAVGMLTQNRSADAIALNEMRFLLDNTQAVIFAKDVEGKYTYANLKHAALFGLTPEDLIGRTDFEIMPREQAVVVRETDLKTLASDEPLTIRIQVNVVDGKRTFVTTRYVLRNANGSARGVCGIAIDDTERVRADELLSETEERYRRTVANAPGMIFRTRREADGSVLFTFVSEGSRSVLGREPEELMKDAQLLIGAIHPEDMVAYRASVRASLETMEPWRWEGRVKHASGEYRWLQAISRPVRVENGATAWDGQIIDRSPERLIEQKLAESQQNFQRMMSQMRDYVFTVQVMPDGETRTIYSSPDSSGIFGGQIDTSGNFANAIGALVHLEDMAMFKQYLAESLAGGTPELECRIIGFDGVTRWIWTRQQRRFEHGRVLVDGICSDVTERHRLVEERSAALNALAARNEELEAANQFKLDLIGMLSHDIGNPLTGIMGFTEIALDDSDLSDMTKRHLQTVMRSAQTVEEIRREVLTMCAIDAGSLTTEREYVNLKHAIANVLSLEGMQFEVQCAEDLHVLVHQVHFNQIVGNFLTNAKKYGGGATGITVKASSQSIDLRVEDQGPGIPAEFVDRLFDRFTRAKQADVSVKGTGLGLFIVRSLAEANQATVWYEPNKPTGSVFVLKLERA